MPVKNAVRKMDRQIEFIQYTGDNIKEIANWIGKPYERVDISKPKIMFQIGAKYQDYIVVCVGKVPLTFGDYVVRADGLFYVWKEKIFNETFECVEGEPKNGRFDK